MAIALLASPPPTPTTTTTETMTISSTSTMMPLYTESSLPITPINKRQRSNTCTNSYESSTKKQRTSFDSDNQNTKKQVRFNLDEPENTIIVPRTDDPTLWWSKEEFQHARRCDLHWLQYYTYCDNDVYKQHLLQVLGVACGKLQPSDQTEASAIFLADSHGRGIERDMTPCFRRRKRHVMANVMQSQAALRKWKATQLQEPRKEGCTPAKVEAYAAKLLAAHYEKLCRPAKTFARLMAQGDEAVVMLQD